MTPAAICIFACCQVVTAASLLQVDAEALTEELAREIISFAGEPVPKTLTRDKAQGARDALCRAGSHARGGAERGRGGGSGRLRARSR